VTSGWLKNRAGPLCSAAVSHSRAPENAGSVLGGTARSARVTGPPSTSRIGTSMASAMCWIMCTLNSTGPYRARPLLVTISSGAQPASHDAVRVHGHASPRRISRRTPAA
jgi:hypothetical protein